MSTIDKKESIAIVGGGITGIAAAIELAKSGYYNVTLFEKESQLGGLSSYYEWQNVICDRFYHVILSTDAYLLEFMRELDLESEFYWCRAKSGFYGRGKLVSFSSIIDFLRFPFLSLWQKFRLGLGILYIAKIKNFSKFDKIYAKQWLINIFGGDIYKNFWEPLLQCKLGDAKERTSAAFIWAIIRRLYGTRSFGTKYEKMGHVRGRYHTILIAAKRKLSELNIKVMTGIPVIKVKSSVYLNFVDKSRDLYVSNPSQSDKKIVLVTRMGDSKFDKVLFTLPCPKVLQILSDINNHHYWRTLQNIEYIGLVCVLLILKRKLSPYYVINLLDKELPFTGIIEATNIISAEDRADKHFVYLPKYIPHNDPIKSLTDDKIKKLFVEKLKTVFLDLRNEDILHTKIFRKIYVQPLHDLNFLKRSISFRTPLSNVYLANSSMVYDSTLNNNAAIRIAQEAVSTIIADSMKGT